MDKIPLTQKESWQNMKTFNMVTEYTKDNKLFKGQLNFSIRGGFPRITLFKDITDVRRETILTAKFNYKRMDRLLTFMSAFKNTEDEGVLFKFLTNAMEYDTEGNPTQCIQGDVYIELYRFKGIFYISLGKLDDDTNVRFKFTDEDDPYYVVVEGMSNEEIYRNTYISQISMLIDTYRTLHTTYLKETQVKLLPKPVTAIG